MMVVLLFIIEAIWPGELLASEVPAPQAPDVNERVNQALGPEGGVQIYMDPDGNVKTILDPPGGEPHSTVQPPQSQSMNLGPPLQLNRPPFQLPESVTPAPPPAQSFPQKAR